MRLIDADTLIGAIRHDVEQTPYSNWGYGLNHAIPIVRSQPTVDAVTVVRCKDCGAYVKGQTARGETARVCAILQIWVKEDFFCADGIKKPKFNDD